MKSDKEMAAELMAGMTIENYTEDKKATTKRIGEAIAQVRQEAYREVEEYSEKLPYKICTDKQHDERYCSRCEAMHDGMDYLLEKFKSEKLGGRDE